MLGLTALALIWGTQYLIIRVGQESLPPLLTVALRYAILGVIAQVLVVVCRARPPRGTWPARLAFGALQALGMGLLYWAEGHVVSSVAAIVIMTEPLLVAVLAPLWIPGERPSARVVVALVCGFVGVALLIAHRPPESDAGALVTVATLAVGLSAVVGALARVLCKDVVSKVPPVVILRDSGWIVTALAIAGSLAFERGRPMVFGTGAILAFAYLGVVASAAASGIYLVLLQRYRVTSLSYLQFVTALVAVATGVLLGREHLGAAGVAGVAVVVAGLAVLVARPALGQHARDT
ncbi:MAG: EamA family transporter [Deltaproteobacteria bacterium]|nr:EamA family transporter [Deltaproteobacteria bacterium]